MNKSSIIIVALAVGLAGCAGNTRSYTQHYYIHHPAAMKKMLDKCNSKNHRPSSVQRNNCSAATGAQFYLTSQSIADNVLAHPNG
ncbi:EexN family lipoprotein [Acidithiobacillus ferrivorans]|nr:EexN family lipoprotein [Acidithiobacillus ferrivorans]